MRFPVEFSTGVTLILSNFFKFKNTVEFYVYFRFRHAARF
jgi:hypothetical protein